MKTIKLNVRNPLARLCLFAVVFFCLQQTALAKSSRLANDLSPYLRSSANSLVDWYPWGDEAFDVARRENKPVFLTIGYSSCFWCQSMDKTVFNDPEVADILNRNFISVKVDREVRPDVDHVYFQATKMIRGGAAWPNNLMLTADLKPFFGSGALTKSQAVHVLKNAVGMWNSDRAGIDNRAEEILGKLNQRHETLSRNSLPLDYQTVNFPGVYYSLLRRAYDSENGGFGKGRKYPDQHKLSFLMTYSQNKGDGRANEMALNSLTKLLRGGLHDHVNGGIYRYTRDTDWQAPHFEKMLYDQAQLVAVLSDAYKQTKDEEYRVAIDKLVRFMDEQLTSPDGLFYASLSAGSPGGEGQFYLWTDQELKKLLGRDYSFFMSFYKLSPFNPSKGKGAQGKGTLSQLSFPKDKSDQIRLSTALMNLKTYKHRQARPQLDNKVLTAWNGAMIAGMAQAGKTLQEPQYIARAERAALKLIDLMQDDTGHLKRVYVNGTKYQNGFLDDYAWLARGLLSLHDATGKPQYKAQALELINIIEHEFRDLTHDGYFFATDFKLPLEVKQAGDGGAIPSSNSVVAHLFVDLYQMSHDAIWQQKAHDVFKTFTSAIYSTPQDHGHIIEAVIRMDGAKVQTNKMIKVQAETKARMPKFVPLDEAAPTDRQPVSSDKVRAEGVWIGKESGENYSVAQVVLRVEQGWHINANPASFEFLVPTKLEVNANSSWQAEILYPPPVVKPTPLGPLHVYEGRTEITVRLRSKNVDAPIGMGGTITVQSCKDEICYPPSRLMVPFR